MSITPFSNYREQIIDFNYSLPSDAQLASWHKQAQAVAIHSQPGLKVINAYHRMGMSGTLPHLYLRECVWQQLQSVWQQLQPHTGLLLFDGFRSRQTQQTIFDDFQQMIACMYPDWDQEAIYNETLTYVSNPKTSEHEAPPPHNTGGAIDLTLYDRASGQPWDFGCAIDTTSEIAHTAFFEQSYDPTLGISATRWLHIQSNRRCLYQLMCHAGFSNYQKEWWHYDLGDKMWAQAMHHTPLFASMETEVLAQYQ